MVTWDLFAGAGGSSEGARQAGARVVWAANHWPLAVEVHALNHPETTHVCQDLTQADFRHVAAPPDLVLASPACQGHSKAATSSGTRGSLPKHDRDRSTAWAVVTCLEATRAPVAVVENVPEFRAWKLFPAWCQAMQALGYSLAEHVWNAADLGVPQHRQRLFITAVHGTTPLELRLPAVPHIAARTILVDTDKGWAPVAGLPDAARARIARSTARYGREFLAHYVSDDVGHSLDAPMKAVTTRHQWALVRDGQRRMLTSREYARAMGFPDTYQLTGKVSHDCRLVGNAVPPPVMRSIVREVMRHG